MRLVAACCSLFAVVGTLSSARQTAVPRPAPLWPGRIVATLRMGGGEGAEFLTTDLDGRPGLEVVAVWERQDEEGRPVGDGRWLTACGWRDGQFRKLAETRFPVGNLAPAAGDVDRDGRDEIYAPGKDNALLAFRLAADSWQSSPPVRLGSWLISSLVVSDVRTPDRAELLLAVDTRRRFDSDAEPECDSLLAYRAAGGKWSQAWRTSIRQRRMTLALLAGDYIAPAGPELVLEHGPPT